MKAHEWSKEKNEWLKKNRNISFEEVLEAIEHNKILSQEKHFNRTKYPNQHMYIVEIDYYAYMIPYVETEEVIFLKTIIPSRKATKKYL